MYIHTAVFLFPTLFILLFGERYSLVILSALRWHMASSHSFCTLFLLSPFFAAKLRSQHVRLGLGMEPDARLRSPQVAYRWLFPRAGVQQWASLHKWIERDVVVARPFPSNESSSRTVFIITTATTTTRLHKRGSACREEITQTLELKDVCLLSIIALFWL